jgi:hypothetical protein
MMHTFRALLPGKTAMGQFVYKPKPIPSGFPKTKSGAPDSTGVVAPKSAPEAADVHDAESRAARKREWAEATKISQQRHALLAKLRNGEVSRESIDPAELLILDEVARVEREQTSAKRGRIVSKFGRMIGLSGLATLFASVSSVSTVDNACMRVAAHPTAVKVALATGGVGLMVAGVLLIIWGAYHWFL